MKNILMYFYEIIEMLMKMINKQDQLYALFK